MTGKEIKGGVGIVVMLLAFAYIGYLSYPAINSIDNMKSSADKAHCKSVHGHYGGGKCFVEGLEVGR